MKTVSEKIKDAMFRKGYATIKECALALGLPYELLRKVVGESHIPKDEQLLTYAQKLNIEPKEILFAAYFQKAPDQFKQYFEKNVIHDTPAIDKIPLVDFVEATNLNFNGHYPPTGNEFIETHLQGKHLFALKIADKAMEPMFLEGELIIIDPKIQPLSGDFVIIKKKDKKDVLFRQLKQYGKFWLLHPLNAAYEDIDMTKDMRILGKIIRKQMDFLKN